MSKQTDTGEPGATHAKKMPNNSRQRAKGEHAYEKYDKPRTVEELAETINMWGLYMQAWGDRVHKAIERLEGPAVAGTGATHLDPPPPPYDPEPT